MQTIRIALAFCFGILGAVVASHSVARAANSMEIVLVNGPHAGTYKLSASNMICLHAKARKQFSAAYKNTDAQDANVISGAGINVFDPDDSAVRHGEINIRFGDPNDNRPAAYELWISRDNKKSLTFTKTGKVVDVAFDGQAKNGIKLRVSATCTDIDEF